MAGAVVALDQIAKALVREFLPLHDSVVLVEGFVNLVHVRNPGAAFSLLADAPAWFRGPFFLGVTAAAVVLLLLLSRRIEPGDRVTPLALGGVLGGALGNLIDRLAWGEVIDFVDVHWNDLHWPAFNVADSTITVSVIVVLARSLFGRNA